MTTPFQDVSVEKIKEKINEIMPPDYAVYYFKLLNPEGNDYLIHTIQIPAHQYIGALEFGTIERGDKPYRPLLRTPFYRHDDLKRLHTLCSRIPEANEDDPEVISNTVSNEITEVEW